MLYYQCRFQRGDAHTIAWIEERGAKLGRLVELLTLDAGGPWRVVSVGDVPLDSQALHEMQRLNRNSLPSLRGN